MTARYDPCDSKVFEISFSNIDTDFSVASLLRDRKLISIYFNPDFSRFSTVVAIILITVGTIVDLWTDYRRETRQGSFLRRIQIKYKYDNYTYAVNPPSPLTNDDDKKVNNGNANHLGE